MGSIPDQGTKIPQASEQCGQEKKKKRKKENVMLFKKFTDSGTQLLITT